MSVTWTSREFTFQLQRRWIGPILFVVVFALVLGEKAFPGSTPKGSLGWLLDLAVAAAGGFGIRYGFRQLREKNMVENVPSSPIRSVAMGLAEIKGHAPAEAALKAPYSGSSCHYFRYRYEEERRNSRGGSQWVTVDQGTSDSPFRVEDPTGGILVNPARADILIRRDYLRTDRGSGWLGKRKRYSEWRIDPGEFVYVIGTVSKLHDVSAERRDRLRERLRQVKQDPAESKRFDLDDNGTLDEQEWAGAVAVIKDDLLREDLAREDAGAAENLVIGAGETETTFVISDRDERSVAAALGRRALAGVVLGGAGALVMVVSILGRFGVLPWGWSFPWGSIFR